MRCIRSQRELDPTFRACPHCGEAVTEFSRRYTNELLDGKYRIVARLGTGGMGEVYKAIHTFLDAERVIKIVRASIAGSDGAEDRFLREARLATRVTHPNVATLHDFAALPDGAAHYMVWEYIEGENLAHLLKSRGTLTPGEAVDIARQALDGLEAIHRAGIVHRDISPENLMITGADHAVKIIDLGVAKMDDPEQNLTKTGMFVGKLRYASPEHLGFLPEGARIDGRADLYSMAIVLYEMLTGRPPFEATSPHQYVLHHSTAAEGKSLDLTRVPIELRPVLARALERDRDKRFPTARAFADALGVAMQVPAQTPLEPLPEATLRVAPEPVPARTTVPTEIDPSPAPPTLPRSPSRLTILAPIVIVAIIIVMWAMRPRTDLVETAKTVTQQAAVTPPPPAASTTQSATSVDVTSSQPAATTSSSPAPAAIIAPPPVTRTTATREPAPPTVTTTHAAPRPQPQSPPQPQPQPQPQPAATQQVGGMPPAGNAPRFTERGDSDANDAAVAKLRTALKGVTRVAIVNQGDPELAEQLGARLTKSGIDVGGGSDVVIYFSGSVEHVGRGRKRRAAHAVVTRSGRVLFRYEMPAEDYRVGDTPAEAFARIIRDAIDR
jgi:serine/threonine-protein kinase